MSTVLFPQPEVEAPENGAWCYYAGVTAIKINWGGADDAKAALAAGKIYATQEDCQQRIAYDAQEMARLVIPQWFRALGPNVEVLEDGIWNDTAARFVDDWAKTYSGEFRAKPAPPDVVHVLDGVEYRWPATAKQGDPAGDRYVVVTSMCSEIVRMPKSGMHGNRTHHTRAGAEAQNAMLRAALGGEV